MSSDTSSFHIISSRILITINCLFAATVFIGLALNPPPSRHAINVVEFHVYSFTCFFFSAVTALGLKLLPLHISKSPPPSDHPIIRNGILVSSVGSACGVVFMSLALINVVQIR